MKFKSFTLITPVLFLIFNRLETTKKVFAEIRKAKPTKLYIAADGPRNEGEKKKTNAVRKYVLSHIDWPCKVKTLFREKNLGCKYAVSGAISWFFKNEERGIILEDDCLPSQSFFRFCQELLEKYKDDEKVMIISGQNLIEEKTKNLKESYWFSRNAFIWGWATWRSVWKNYDVEIHKKISFLNLLKISSSVFDFIRNSKRIKDLKKEKVKTWDYQLDFYVKLNNGLCIVPKINLVENIGFLKRSLSNSFRKEDIKFLYKKRKDISFPLIHPKNVKENKKLDKYFLKKELKKVLSKKLKLFIKN